MDSTSRSLALLLLLVLLLVLGHGSSSTGPDSAAAADPQPQLQAQAPTPTPWPLQFHSILFMNFSGAISLIDLWYDWPKGRNFNIIQDQLGQLLYDLEWNNGTSFVYTLDDPRRCSVLDVGFGILRPNWLDGAEYLGQERVDGFLCNVWQKVDFIWYYEDVATKRPVHWIFYTGRSAHVMTFEVGATLEDEKWQGPVYCFQKDEDELRPENQTDLGEYSRRILTDKRSFRGLSGF